MSMACWLSSIPVVASPARFARSRKPPDPQPMSSTLRNSEVFRPNGIDDGRAALAAQQARGRRGFADFGVRIHRRSDRLANGTPASSVRIGSHVLEVKAKVTLQKRAFRITAETEKGNQIT